MKRRPQRHVWSRRRDVPSRATVDALLGSWSVDGDREAGLVAADALRVLGYEDVADDLNESLRRKRKPGFQKRRGLLARIRSEIDDGRVLARGQWVHTYPNGKTYYRTYVATWEEPKQRAVLWTRRDDTGEWTLWGEYSLKEFRGNVRELMRVLESDIRYESLSLEKRQAMLEERERRRLGL